jgi:hypothetical protein
LGPINQAHAPADREWTPLYAAQAAKAPPAPRVSTHPTAPRPVRSRVTRPAPTTPALPQQHDDHDHPDVTLALDIFRRVQRHAHHRHIGFLLMYSAAFFILILFGVLASAMLQNTAGLAAGRPLRLAQQPPWIQIPAYISIVGLTISIPITFAGLIIRIAASTSLSRTLASVDPQALGPLPPPTRGERLGWWVITRLDSDAITLTRRIAPAAIWVIARWSITTLVVGLTVVTVAVGIRQRTGGSLLVAIGILLVGVPLILLFRTTVIELDARRQRLTVRTRINRLLPSFGLTRPLSTLAAAAPAANTVRLDLLDINANRPNADFLLIDRLNTGRWGHWQALRLAALLDAFRRSTSPISGTAPAIAAPKPTRAPRPNPFAPPPLPINQPPAKPKLR